MGCCSMRKFEYEKKEVCHSVNKSDSSIVINFTRECKSLSSSILNGGFQKTNTAIILKVDENFEGKKNNFEDPAETILKYSKTIKQNFPIIGMMTSALMDSYREVKIQKDDVIVSAFLTAGVSNAKCAGEKAEWQSFEQRPYTSGTINIIVYTNLNLSEAAMTEAVMIISEAKAVALQELKILTPDKNIATGTGTDSTAIVCEQKGTETKFCGKHTLLGEMIGKSVVEALKDSLNEK